MAGRSRGLSVHFDFLPSSLLVRLRIRAVRRGGVFVVTGVRFNAYSLTSRCATGFDHARAETDRSTFDGSAGADISNMSMPAQAGVLIAEVWFFARGIPPGISLPRITSG